MLWRGEDSSLLTATECGVLQDVWHASVIWRVGLEADRENIVTIVPGNVKMFSACLIVLQVQCSQLEFWYMLSPKQCEAVKLLTSLGMLGELRDSPLGSVDCTAQHCRRHDSDQYLPNVRSASSSTEEKKERNDTVKPNPPSSKSEIAALKQINPTVVMSGDLTTQVRLMLKVWKFCYQVAMSDVFWPGRESTKLRRRGC